MTSPRCSTPSEGTSIDKDFVWEIKSWKTISKFSHRKSIETHFYDGYNLWRLQLYPNGRTEFDQNNVSIYLTHHRDFYTCEVSVEISLLDNSYNPVISNDHHFFYQEDVFLEAEDFGNSVIAFPNFINNCTNDQNIINILEQDKIMIVCKTTSTVISHLDLSSIINSLNMSLDGPIEEERREESTFNSNLAESTFNSYQENSESLTNNNVEQDNFEKFLENKAFSDVTFKLEEKEIFSHKILLANKSSVLSNIFETNTEVTNENVIHIIDTKYEVFIEMLRYIYTGKVNNIQIVAKELYVLATKYCVEDLKLLCEKYISQNITVDNIIGYIEFAVESNSSFLTSEISKFILANKKAFVELLEFRSLIEKFPEFMYDIFIKFLE